MLMRRLSAEAWRIAPLAIVRQGRVAVGEEVGELLGAQAVVVLIGERPGLSSPDSMGLYLTWQPRIGLIDARIKQAQLKASQMGTARVSCPGHEALPTAVSCDI
jgi:ethanolamine ammonia-lyase small subunit